MAINITGTSGNDRLNGSPADPAASVNVTGLGGNDTIFGSTNADTLFGNPGDDYIRGNGGSDAIYGGQGNDFLAVTGNQTSSLEPARDVKSLVVGGLGRDTITVSNDLGFLGIFPTGTFQGQVTVYGGNEGSDPADDADTISVSLNVDSRATIFSNGGNDSLFLNATGRTNAAQVASNFYAHGGQGNDTISGSVGTDSTVVGGLDSDVVNVSATNAVTVYGGNGTDDARDGSDVITVSLSRDGLSPSYVPKADIFGNGGNDAIVLNTGSTPALANIYGGRGGDGITVNGAGLASKSAIYGGVGADTITANVAGTGVSIIGGNGTEDPTDGRDVITVNLVTGSSVSIFGNGGDDVITINGQGSATAFGGVGDDTFNVGPSAASASSVVLTGGVGSDIYNVGVGAVASATAPIVRITDFDFDEDRIFGTDAESLRVVEQSVNNLAELKGIASQATASTAVLINVQSGALAGTYLAYSAYGADQLINITGYTGTAEADVFIQAL